MVMIMQTAVAALRPAAERRADEVGSGVCGGVAFPPLRFAAPRVRGPQRRRRRAIVIIVTDVTA